MFNQPLHSSRIEPKSTSPSGRATQEFRFSTDPTLAEKVRREASFTMFPTISGELHEGSQLPFSIEVVH
jgi:hypothetical protein